MAIDFLMFDEHTFDAHMAAPVTLAGGSTRPLTAVGNSADITRASWLRQIENSAMVTIIGTLPVTFNPHVARVSGDRRA